MKLAEHLYFKCQGIPSQMGASIKNIVFQNCVTERRAVMGLKAFCKYRQLEALSAYLSLRKNLHNRGPCISHVWEAQFKDFGKLPWVKDVLNTVSNIVRETKAKRKLLERLRQQIVIHNREVDLEAQWQLTN